MGITVPGGVTVAPVNVSDATVKMIDDVINVIQGGAGTDPNVVNSTVQSYVPGQDAPPPPSTTDQGIFTVLVADTTQAGSTEGPIALSVPDGYDALVVSGSAAVSVTGNANATEQLIALNDADNTVYTAGGSGTVVAGQGNNLIGTATTGGAANIIAGNGNNTIVAASGNNTIAAGVGHNQILIVGGNNVANVAGASTVFGGAGSDTVGAFGSGAMVVGGTGSMTAVNVGSNNTIIGGAGGGLLSGGTGTNSTIVGGAGTETIIGGAGGDVLFAGGAGGDLVVAGSGSQTLSGAASTGSNTFIAGSGSTLIGAGIGNDTVISGTGQSTVFGGGGANLYATFSSHSAGSTTYIADFSFGAGDRLTVQGFGMTNQQLAQSATVSGGDTIITLPDGTRIILAGVTNVNSSFFI